MHLLIALKCPSSRSLFCLGFYLESCYNLCRAIRVFLSSGCGRSGSVEQGKEPGVNRGRRGSVSGMCPAYPRNWDSSQPRTEQLPGSEAARNYGAEEGQNGKKSLMEPGCDGKGAHSPAGLGGRVLLGTG